MIFERFAGIEPLSMKKTAYLLASFGGPRTLLEVEPFLKELLTDRDVIRTKMPGFIHRILFQRIAKKRTPLVSQHYELIGGKSPLVEDTEALAMSLREKLSCPVLTFHRYLGATHERALRSIERLDADRVIVFPLFPQFTYATSGSIARFFCKSLTPKALNRLRWVKSYPSHRAFVALFQEKIRSYLIDNKLLEKETILLFSAHGVPKNFIETGDVYQAECEEGFHAIVAAFPEALCRLAYQSQFGPEQWLRPYTIDMCESIAQWCERRKNVLFIPLSFTSDHIETLYEVEYEYMPIIKEQGLDAYRLNAFNRSPAWVDAVTEIIRETPLLPTSMLVRWKKG